jgi:hypothetical protein
MRQFMTHPGWSADQASRTTVQQRPGPGASAGDGETTVEWSKPTATIRLTEFCGRATVEGVDTRRITLSQIPAALLGQIFRLGVEGEKNKRDGP